MKTILLCVATALVAVTSFAADAATDVALSTAPCTSTYICYNVNNDAGLQIEYLSYSANYKRLTMSIDGMLYDSGVYAAPAVLDHVPLYPTEGAVIYVTVTFTAVHPKPCVRSGKVTVCPVTVTLTGGSVEQP